jgi:ABC-type branched-subunit amino acid transport system ATPase component/ABC-type branched-subunit amino acid transport system permease subunit
LRSSIASLPRRRVQAGVLAALVVIALFVIPTWPPHAIAGGPDNLLSTAGLAAIWGMVAVGTAMFVSLGGLPTLAHAGLWGVGAYGSGIAMSELGLGFWPSLLFAALVPLLVALPVGLISLRTSGVAFLVVTIAFTEFIVLLLTNMDVTGGPAGLLAEASPGKVGPFDFSGLEGQYYLFLAFLFATLGLYRWLTRSAFGARLRAIRDDQRLARSLGFNVLFHQLVLFEITAVIVGVAGALLLVQQQAITPSLFTAFQFIPIYLAMVVGGLTVIAGPALGAWLAQFLPLWIGSEDPNISLLIYGLILVAAMLFLPKGLLGTIAAWVGRDPKTQPVPPPPEEEVGPTATEPPAVAPMAQRRELSPEVVLEVSGLKRWFGANRALDGVDIEVREGEIRGVIGPNGSGKTTLLNCVSGFLATTEGSIEYRGERIDGARPDRLARLGLVRTFQEPEVFESFSVGETCELICRTAARRQNLNDALPATAAELLEACGLSDVAAAPVAILPYGQLRLLGVAAAIACRPHLLLLDEPAAGLAPNDAAALRNVILQARDRGVTVVVIDHDMSFLLPLCDRVTVLDGGCKLAEGEPDAVADDPSVIAAYLGERFATERAAALAETGSKA